MKQNNKLRFNQIVAAIIVALPAITVAQTEHSKSIPSKVSHAEPLYYDLVRDLGARKGEKELNVGADFKSIQHYNEYALLAEYEFAPINRLGLEVEADFSFFRRTQTNMEIPQNKLECLRFSSQYSFFVSQEHKMTFAVGYTQIFNFIDFNQYGKRSLITHVVYNPFIVAAKRWGKNFHSLIYAYPLIEYDRNSKTTGLEWQINTSVHYSIPQTKHLVGIEINKTFNHNSFAMTLRPQLKIKLNKKLAIGFVAGIPIKRKESFSSFLRIIYEL